MKRRNRKVKALTQEMVDKFSSLLDADSRLIPLTKGFAAIVDAADYEELSRVNWSASVNHRGDVYATRAVQNEDGSLTKLKMHRILALSDAEMNNPKIEVDHRNHDTLNNRRSNLRACSHMNNTRNKNTKGKGLSRFKGVGWCKASKRWRARICTNYIQKKLGYFLTEEDAARAYDTAAREAHGEFVCVNFPTSQEAGSAVLQPVGAPAPAS